MDWSYGPGLRRLWARVRVCVVVMDQGYGGYGPGLGYGLELKTVISLQPHIISKLQRSENTYNDILFLLIPHVYMYI